MSMQRDLSDLRKLLPELRSMHNGNHTTITISAGGIGVWMAVTCTFVMFAINVCLLVAGAQWLGRIDRENSEHGHQLNAIYMLAPHLKPKKEDQSQ